MSTDSAKHCGVYREGCYTWKRNKAGTVHMVMKLRLDILSFLEGRNLRHGVVHCPSSDFGDCRASGETISTSTPQTLQHLI